MTPSEAFDYVLNHYNVIADEIARQSGVSKSDISKFRNGKLNIGSDKLQKLVQALPTDAKAHFNMLFAYENSKKKTLKVGEKSNEYKV